MSKIKEKLKKNHPIHYYIQKKNRKRLKNRDFTLLTSNCLGGIIYHELGLKFLSPTINIRMDSPDFIKFVANIQDYLINELKFIHSEEPFPVAYLGDVRINFVHYKTDDEAMQKWEERKKRINWDNVWIITNDLDGVTEKDLEKLQNIKYAKGIVVFSQKCYHSYNFIKQIPIDKNGSMKNIMKVNSLLGIREIERYFDYVGWLNNGYQ